MLVGASCVPSYWSATIEYTCTAVIAGNSRLDLIKQYFTVDLLTLKLFFCCFFINYIKISLRQLNKILKSNNLRRRIGYTPEHIVKNYISNEIETSGQCIGYRSMWKRLVNEHRIRVPRDKLLSFMKTIDPEGVSLRTAHRLKDASTEQKT